MTGYATPEECAEDSTPQQYVRVVLVDQSPDGRFAVVLIEYNEPPSVEPYIVLCERTANGWVSGQGSAGGGLSWMATDAAHDVGVEVAWGQSPVVRWDVRASGDPAPGV